MNIDNVIEGFCKVAAGEGLISGAKKMLKSRALAKQVKKGKKSYGTHHYRRGSDLANAKSLKAEGLSDLKAGGKNLAINTAIAAPAAIALNKLTGRGEAKKKKLEERKAARS